MLGAIIGDIVGSRFEFEPTKSKEFELFGSECRFTDDTVMTCAIAKALLEWDRGNSKQQLDKLAIKYMQELGRKYPEAGYGGNFSAWLEDKDPLPYNSYGNGAAMRVSAVGWVANSLLEAQDLAKTVTGVTHNHPDGIKGAVATAGAIYLAKTGKSKGDILNYVGEMYISVMVPLDEYKDDYKFEISCKGTVPTAIRCFIESNSYEDTIRNAIAMGGDSDTLAAIAGAIAEAYYGIDKKLISKGLSYLGKDLLDIVNEFNTKYIKKRG